MCKFWVNSFLLILGYAWVTGVNTSATIPRSGRSLKDLKVAKLDLAPAASIQESGTSYSVEGDPWNFPDFDASFPSGTNSIRIKYHRIDLSRFIPKVGALPGLTSIILESVLLVNETARFGRVTLPSLRRFIFHHIESSSSFLEDELVNSPFSLKSLLFFDKSDGVEWELPQIWGLGVDISLKIGDFTVLELTHPGGVDSDGESGPSFSSALKDPNSMLQNLPQTLSRLSFTGTWHNTFVDPSFIPRNLSYLRLHRVRTNLDELELLLNGSNNLKELVIRDLRPSARIDISKMPVGIRRLSLIQTIFYFRSASRRYNLDSLVLFGSESEDFFYPNYERVLNARNVAFSEKYHETSTNRSYAILRSILNTTRAENIYLQNFYRKPQGFENRSDILEFEDFLGNASVPRDSLDFHLKKLADDSWLGRPISPEESEYALLSGFEGFLPRYRLIDPEKVREELIPLGLSSLEFFQFINLPFFERQSRGSVGSIHFNDVEIFAPSFPRLVRGFGQLRYLTLENIRAFGKFPSVTNVSLPRLKSFSISKHRPREDVKTNWAEKESFGTEDIDSALFFNRARQRQVTQEVWTLGTNLRFAAGRVIQFEINREQREIISSLKSINDFIAGADRPQRALFDSWGIRDAPIDLDLIPKAVTYLNLQNIDFLSNDTDLNLSLTPMNSLRELYLFPEFKFSLQRRALPLTGLPTGLRSVYLRNLVISDGLTFVGVSNLTFHDCILADEGERAINLARNIRAPAIHLFGLNYPRVNLGAGFLDALLENNGTRRLFFDNLRQENLSESTRAFLNLQGLDASKGAIEDLLLTRETPSSGWTVKILNLVERELLFQALAGLEKFKLDEKVDNLVGKPKERQN